MYSGFKSPITINYSCAYSFSDYDFFFNFLLALSRDIIVQ